MSYAEIGVDKEALKAAKDGDFSKLSNDQLAEIIANLARLARPASKALLAELKKRGIAPPPPLEPGGSTAPEGPSTLLLIGGGVLVAAGVAYFAMRK